MPINPNKLTIIHNADKKWHDKWEPGRNWGNFPHPFRALMIGKPGCGKTSAAQNILIRQKPMFKNLMVVHCDSEYSEEWDNCDPTTVTDKIPDFRDLDTISGKDKMLIVFEDFKIDKLDRTDSLKLDRLFGYCSTHKNVSIICCQQDPKSVPVQIRRMSNLFVLWRGNNLRTLDYYGTTMGLDTGELKYYIKKYCKKIHDSIWIDLTPNTPCAIRLNCYSEIKKDLCDSSTDEEGTSSDYDSDDKSHLLTDEEEVAEMSGGKVMIPKKFMKKPLV
jgi:hypothetical protein